MSEWISIEDRLPRLEDTNEDLCVLAIHKSKSCKKQYFHYKTVQDNRFDFTHWQPLPKPPETKKNPFDRVEDGETYYGINSVGHVEDFIEYAYSYDINHYNIANYCTDRELMEQRALHETLNRLLWRFTYENGWSEEFWNDINIGKYIIQYNLKDRKFVFDYWNLAKVEGTVYYKDRKTALRAVDEIIKPFMEEHPNFVW